MNLVTIKQAAKNIIMYTIVNGTYNNKISSKLFSVLFMTVIMNTDTVIMNIIEWSVTFARCNGAIFAYNSSIFVTSGNLINISRII